MRFKTNSWTARKRSWLTQKNLQIEIPLRDILYVEGTPYRRVLLHTTEAASPVLECRGKMNDYTERLSGKGFIRLQKVSR